MAQYLQLASPEIKLSGINSLLPNLPKNDKWNEIFYILLRLPDHIIWNVIVLLSVMINFYFVTICFCFLPHSFLDFPTFYMVSDFIYSFNFIMLLLPRFLRNLPKNLPANMDTSNFFLLLDLISILPQVAFPIVLFKSEYGYLLFYCRSVTSLRLPNLLFFRKINEDRWVWYLVRKISIFLVILYIANSIWYFVTCKYIHHRDELYWQNLERRDSIFHWYDLGVWYFMTVYTNVQQIIDFASSIRFGDFLPISYHEILWFIVVIDRYLDDYL